ncbi:zinc-dependent metalloprotease [Caldimonas tepidiphila]|uniref:zinc-dependent metalloprotease n=1 Tax=Caldimonas tepidiphila TaxID=2315841 RepID=UPI000E5B8832|nr:zinc-dependent metalloprotease [Caldimonas tepidiphila]
MSDCFVLRPPPLLALSLALLAGCASLPPEPAATAVVVAQTASGGATPLASALSLPQPATPAGTRGFDDVVRGAVRSEGFLPLWRRDDRLWIEIPEEMFERPFLLAANVSHSVGERGLYGSQMGPSWVASFRRVGSQVQLLARNMAWRAEGDLPSQRAVEQAFSDSLLASGPMASAPHPQRKSVLVDAAMLLADLPGYGASLERAYRLPYLVDRANSFFERGNATADMSTLSVRLHFSTPRLPVAPGGAPPPSTLPDGRSLFVGLVYSFARLPETPMRPRRADPRLGHFTDAFTDLGGQARANPRVHHVKRWRLEKKEPDAALSEPKQPIQFWLDRNIPERYRAAVTAGVLEWNKAFERIGFRDAIVVQQQPDDADWDTLDSRHASIRWFVGADVGFAIGPSHSDPRSGEILDADIGMSDVFARGARRFIVEDAGLNSEQRLAQLMGQAHAQGQAQARGEPAAQCHYAMEAASEMHFALDMLESRGDIAADSPQAEAVVQAAIKDTIMHEVGHALGLKHNFKASTTVPRERLQDAAWTAEHGISGSVMDYNAFNLAASGERQGQFSNTTLGPYDYWAIEYAYRPLDAASEAAELARIAARSSEPQLAYADDHDAGGFGGIEGFDPLANRFDLGDDPLAWFRKRLTLSQEMWQREQQRLPQASDEATRQRRVMLSGFRQLARSAELVSKYVGGMEQVRSVPGAAARPVYTPLPAERQREALQFLTRGLFGTESFRFRPEFVARLSPDFLDRGAAGPVSVPQAVLSVQSTVLDRLMSPGTATRVLELPNYAPQQQGRGARAPLTLHEVYGSVQDAVWSELPRGTAIDPLRRNLQREHLRRVQAQLTGGAAMPPDALSLTRLHATALRERLKRASANARLPVETRAHLLDSLNTLEQALKASMLRG